MMKSQVDMNQLNEQSHQRQKGKVGLGYVEESESSKQGAQNNQRPTFSHCGKIGHTSNRCLSNEKKNSMKSATIAIIMVIGQMNSKRNLSLKENFINVTSMGTSH